MARPAGTVLCSVENMGVCLEEIIDEWDRESGEAFEKAIDATMQVMVDETKVTAPKDEGDWEKKGFPNHRKGTHGEFRRKIAMRKDGGNWSHSATWYVKAPEYKLAHLLVHGHEQFVFGRDTGKKTDGDRFLHDARDGAAELLPGNIKVAIESVSV